MIRKGSAPSESSEWVSVSSSTRRWDLDGDICGVLVGEDKGHVSGRAKNPVVGRIGICSRETARDYDPTSLEDSWLRLHRYQGASIGKALRVYRNNGGSGPRQRSTGPEELARALARTTI
jgi:hypothetical protein